ncbi:MAG: chorismate-binding protein [Peptococcaceae bacterium]|jgi:anthranilate synthase component 1|nr:chorismate-binding protein [Peptococcaceae bacterium]
MNMLPNIHAAQELARSYPLIPTWRVIPSLTRQPLDVFLALKRLSRQCFVLDSAEVSERGRWTFLGYDPKLEITCLNGRLTLRSGAEHSFTTKQPNAEIRSVLAQYRAPRVPELPPFAGGLVGYFAYDYIRYSEPSLQLDAVDQENFHDLDLMLFDKVIAFDHLENQIFLIINIRTDALEENYSAAQLELEKMAHIVNEGEMVRPEPLHMLSEFRHLFDENAYCQMVDKAKRHIYEGDIFQVVLSNRLDADAEGSLYDVYSILRETNPSPYMFYFSSDHLEIAGAAPETLITLRDGTLFTFPLAGTRPRGQTPEEDARLERELLADEKELAEHNMLVDLGRNDVGRISEFGSVSVDAYLQILRFSHVMHIGSTVTGKIRADLDALDAIAAVLPAGTLSGAPKIRACEIIHKLENNKRGIYGGGIGYISFTGDMDTCIAIRIAFKRNGKVFVRAGAGIVADSVPEREYAECNQKMRAVLKAIEQASTGKRGKPNARKGENA